MRNWTFVATVVLLSGFAASASAQTPKYIATPWTFVGTALDCGTAGSKIVTAAWLAGAGLPDNGTANPDGSRDPHNGLLLSKNGPTPNCAAAGATIDGWTAGDTVHTLGFDYRNGGHCGAGAPRFNVTDMAEHVYFFGCAGGTHTASPQDPAEWERVTFTDGAQGFPPEFVFGVTPVKSIEIVLDEGTDSPSTGDPGGVGLAVLDNIRINNTVIRKKVGAIVTP